MSLYLLLCNYNEGEKKERNLKNDWQVQLCSNTSVCGLRGTELTKEDMNHKKTKHLPS